MPQHFLAPAAFVVDVELWLWLRAARRPSKNYQPKVGSTAQPGGPNTIQPKSKYNTKQYKSKYIQIHKFEYSALNHNKHTFSKPQHKYKTHHYTIINTINVDVHTH